MEADPRSGSLDAETLFRRHADYVARFLFRLGVPEVDLDDVVQEVFLVVHARGGYAPGPAKPTSYLGAIATRAAMGHRRKVSREQRRKSGLAPDELQAQGASPARALSISESGRALERALQELDPQLAATLLLVEQEGESCQSVAAAMGTAVGTIHWRLHKARKKLQQSLRRIEGEPRKGRGSLTAAQSSHGET